jgi:hypothetical protein
MCSVCCNLCFIATVYSVTMIYYTCGLYGSYQWLLYVYHSLMVAFKSMCPMFSHIYTPFSALPCFWPGHDLQVDPML